MKRIVWLLVTVLMLTGCTGSDDCMDRAFAVKFSFIVSIPAILGAAVLDVPDMFKETLSSGEIVNSVVGTVVAAVVGYVCIKTMLKVVRKKKFKGFAAYCAIMGLVAVIGFFII